MSMFISKKQSEEKKIKVTSKKKENVIKPPKKSAYETYNETIIDHLDNLNSSYNLVDFDTIINDIHKKINEKYEHKKVRKIVSQYVSVDKGKIKFDTRFKKNMDYKKIRELLKSGNKPEENQFGVVLVTSSSEELTNAGNSSDDEIEIETYTYPEQPVFKVNKRTDEIYGPFGTQWFHDNQIDDIVDNEDIIRRSKQLDILMNIEYPPQRSAKWFALRDERMTASDAGTILNMNKHQPQYDFLTKKVKRPPFESNKFCYHGTKFEQIATMIYEYRMNVKVNDFGLVAHPTIDFLAASPDGIIGKYKLDGKTKTKYVGRMLEIKCPVSRKINMEGEIKGEICPLYYWAQVQMQLECCDLDECDFWQCEIWEYDDKEEFLRDTNLDQPFLAKSSNMEKGCLIQLLPKSKVNELKDKDKYWDVLYGESKHLYPPKIEMSPYDCDMWIANTMSDFNNICRENGLDSNDYFFDKVIYWKAIKTKCVVITRDKKWFNDSLNDLAKMWKYVTYLRKNENKSNLLFSWINSLSLKSNKKIMDVVDRLCNEPNDSDKKQVKEYNNLILKLQEEVDAYNKKKDEEEEIDSDSDEHNKPPKKNYF